MNILTNGRPADVWTIYVRMLPSGPWEQKGEVAGVRNARKKAEQWRKVRRNGHIVYQVAYRNTRTGKIQPNTQRFFLPSLKKG